MGYYGIYTKVCVSTWAFPLQTMEEGRNRRARRYYPRVNPLTRFETERKFRRRYRLDKEKVREIADDFGRSRYAPRGMRSGGGLSNEERVSNFSPLYINVLYSVTVTVLSATILYFSN